jgi:hypothetical protein
MQSAKGPCGAGRIAAVCGLIALLWPVPGQGEEAAWLASARLRGGYDANPMLLPGKGNGSAFGGVDAAFAAGHGDDDRRIGVTGEAQHVEFAKGGIVPSDRQSIALKAETEIGKGWSLRATTQATNVTNYNVRAFDAVATAKLRPDAGTVRPFLTTELRYATLNEPNAVLGDFLPEPQKFSRATAIPGVVLVTDKFELGTSVNVSATRYTQEPDLFGFKRNNERVQPYLFASVKDQGLELSGSVSYLRGTWHDVDFSPVREVLWDVALSKTAGDLTVELSAQRGVEDTTFPVSPLTVVTSYSATLSYAATAALSLRVFARGLRTDYLDSPFTARTQAYGAGVNYDLGKFTTLALDVSRVTGRQIDGTETDGGVAMLSIGMKFASQSETGGDKTQRAVAPPPTALSPNPALDVRTAGRPYQP